MYCTNTGAACIQSFSCASRVRKNKKDICLLKEELIATVGIAEYKDFAFIDDDLFACRPVRADGRVQKGVTSLLTQVILVSASYIVV